MQRGLQRGYKGTAKGHTKGAGAPGAQAHPRLISASWPEFPLSIIGTPWNSLELLGTPWNSKERPRETLPRSTRFLVTSNVLSGGLDCVPGCFEHVFEKFDPRRPRPRGRSLLVEHKCGDGWRKTRKHARARKTTFAFKRVSSCQRPLRSKDRGPTTAGRRKHFPFRRAAEGGKFFFGFAGFAGFAGEAVFSEE